MTELLYIASDISHSNPSQKISVEVNEYLLNISKWFHEIITAATSLLICVCFPFLITTGRNRKLISFHIVRPIRFKEQLLINISF